MFLQSLQTNPTYYFAVVITVVISICVHELAHGIVAIKLGDRTPIETGHMTLNPIVHLGLFSVIALLLTGIAWGAMPVDRSRLRGRYGDALVALAGPASNVVLALLALTALGLWIRFVDVLPFGTPAGNLQYLLRVFGFVNFMLAMFNLIPIPPLDGASALGSFSEGFKRLTEQLTANGGSMILFIVAFSAAGNVIAPAAWQLVMACLRAVSGEDLVAA